MKALRYSLVALVALATHGVAAAPVNKIQFTDTKLKNGLRVIISEDHSAPVFAVAVNYNVGSREEVDRVIATAVAAGARVTSPAQERFWGGYSGYFSDPDGFLWEIAWNPHFTIE